MRVDIDRCVAIAVDESKRGYSKQYSYSHWSFVFQNKKLLSYGRNVAKQEYLMKRFGYNRKCGGIHSETVAMRKAYGLLDRRRSWELINISLTATHTLRMSAPCPVCRSFIAACGCSICHFSIIDGFAKVTI